MELGTLKTENGNVTLELRACGSEPWCCYVVEDGQVIDLLTWEEAEEKFADFF